MSYLPIEIKTTGQLVDELTIAELKVQHGNPYMHVSVWELRQAVATRFVTESDGKHDKLKQAQGRMEELAKTNATIWSTIDAMVAGKGNADMAKQVQILNAERRQHARAIDQLLGGRDIDNKQFDAPQHA